MNRSVLSIVAISAIIATASCGYAGVASFQGLGLLPGGTQGFGSGISADGSVVVGRGNSSIPGQEAFRWTAGGGMIGLGSLPGGGSSSAAFGTSADGAIIVGSSSTAFNSTSTSEAFRWTASGGMVGLGFLPVPGDKPSASTAIAASADGSIVVGLSPSISGPGGEAFRWTATGGIVGLGDLPGGSSVSGALATSADGSVVVGYGNSASGQEAFRWTQATGMVGLGDLPGGDFSSLASATSADGSVVVGGSVSASSGPAPEAFRWTADDGMVGLGFLPGGSFGSDAKATSADGSVVVGSGNTASGFEAFLWTAGGGMRSLQDILTSDLDLDLTGWQLVIANAISADGLTIAGTGINPNGQNEAFIATIPEPGTVAILGSGILMLLRRHKVTRPEK